MTYSKLLSALVCGVCIVAVAAPANAQTRTFNIPAGSLKSALDAYGRQSARPIIYQADQVRGFRSPGARGTMSAEAALNAILAGTAFRWKTDSSGAVAIVRVGNGLAPGSQGDASFTPASAAEPATAGEAAEIIVTAQKRDENLQDVPVPVSVLRGQTLAENNVVLLRDFADTVPSLNVSPGPSGGNQQMVVLRGIASSSFGNPTVGVTVDDIPFGAFTREYSPDVDPSDLARVEVLRGPQGTLYGASSMGGLIKYVTVDPSTSRLSGRVEAGVNGVHNGEGPGYSLRVAVNAPVMEDLAVRVSAFSRKDPGYIDNPVLGRRAVNDVYAQGVRASSLWHIADDWSLKASALYQRTRGEGLSEVVIAPGLGDLEQNYIRGKVLIAGEYVALKLKELRLTHEYREKQKQEREERAEAARAEREEKRLLAEAREAEREEEKWQALLDKARQEVGPSSATEAMRQKIESLEAALAEAHERTERARAMAELTKSGYVYVISNVGSFGEDLVKIGLTRRLNPDDRIRELGDASVPFTFDTHAMIYSDQAPVLEAALHTEFADRRINMSNMRKEFFRVSLDEVEEAVQRLAPEASFFKDREAQEWHETLARRNEQLRQVQAAAFPSICKTRRCQLYEMAERDHLRPAHVRILPPQPDRRGYVVRGRRRVAPATERSLPAHRRGSVSGSSHVTPNARRSLRGPIAASGASLAGLAHCRCRRGGRSRLCPTMAPTVVTACGRPGGRAAAARRRAQFPPAARLREAWLRTSGRRRS